MMPDYTVSLNVTIGLTQATQMLVLKLINTLQGKLSADDQAALAGLLAADKALLDKANAADGKPVA